MLYDASGETLQRLLTAPDNRIAKFIQAKTDSIDIVREAYWSTLSREPSPSEELAGVKLLGAVDADPATRRAALEDLYWSLLTSHEFVIRR